MPTGASNWGFGWGRALTADRCIRFAAVVAAALSLAACSRAPMPQLTHAAAPTPKPAPKAATTPDTDPDLVTAVGTGNAALPISVKFRIGKRPRLGVPLQILVAIIPAPAAQIANLHGSFLPDTGLNLQGDHSFDVKELRTGEPLERQLTVVPEQPGVLNVNATFTLDLDSGTVSRSYAIPVIVGDNSS
jgi:hypothetical protein